MEIEELQRRLGEAGSRLESATMVELLEIYAAQRQRYEWFASRVDHEASVERLAAVLEAEPCAPAAWERALVALSLLGTARARRVLVWWQPPVHDVQMTLFYEVCAERCRPADA